MPATILLDIFGFFSPIKTAPLEDLYVATCLHGYCATWQSKYKRWHLPDVPTVQTLQKYWGWYLNKQGFLDHPSAGMPNFIKSQQKNQWPASDSDASSFWSTRVMQLAFLENLFNVFLAAPDQWRRFAGKKTPANLPNLHLTIASRFVSNSRQFEGCCAFMTYSQVLVWILNDRTID